MQSNVRTTIRIRSDLLKQSRLLALEKGASLQEVINDLLVKGFSHISDLNTQKNAMVKIDSLRRSLKDKKIDLKELLARSRRDLR